MAPPQVIAICIDLAFNFNRATITVGVGVYLSLGDYSLRISPVTLEDDAEFQCQVTGVGDVAGVRSQSAKLTVYVPPERPEISQGTVVTSTAGAGVQIDCVSRGGKPAAEVRVYLFTSFNWMKQVCDKYVRCAKSTSSFCYFYLKIG
jgi:hypothetical protein